MFFYSHTWCRCPKGSHPGYVYAFIRQALSLLLRLAVYIGFLVPQLNFCGILESQRPVEIFGDCRLCSSLWWRRAKGEINLRRDLYEETRYPFGSPSVLSTFCLHIYVFIYLCTHSPVCVDLRPYLYIFFILPFDFL